MTARVANNNGDAADFDPRRFAFRPSACDAGYGGSSAPKSLRMASKASP
jgi:hypothetical protein